MTNDLTSALEALLFIYGEPLDAKKAASVLGVKPEEIKEAVKKLQQSLSEGGRGLAIVTDSEQFQLITKPAFAGLLEKVVKAELAESLTPAAIETLSIVAYGGPISRSEIDYIRGVNSSFILRALAMRGLVNREQDPHRANAYVYAASFDLLKHLGVSRVEDLPEYEKFRTLALKVKSPGTETAPAPKEFHDIDHVTDEEAQAIE